MFLETMTSQASIATEPKSFPVTYTDIEAAAFRLFGIATLSPKCRVIGVEPAQADDATRSFYTKTLQTVHNSKWWKH